jgi:hypothetical protein
MESVEGQAVIVGVDVAKEASRRFTSWILQHPLVMDSHQPRGLTGGEADGGGATGDRPEGGGGSLEEPR